MIDSSAKLAHIGTAEYSLQMSQLKGKTMFIKKVSEIKIKALQGMVAAKQKHVVGSQYNGLILQQK